MNKLPLLFYRKESAMIIQGSNAPILLTFGSNMESISDFSATLISRRLEDKDAILKQWRKEDVEIAGSDIILPLTQEETLAFPYGVHTLEVKWVNEDDGDILFADAVKIDIEKRVDKTTLSV